MNPTLVTCFIGRILWNLAAALRNVSRFLIALLYAFIAADVTVYYPFPWEAAVELPGDLHPRIPCLRGTLARARREMVA